jgi:hypothetical protein
MQRRQKQKQINGHIQDEIAWKRFDFAHNKRDRILDGYMQRVRKEEDIMTIVAISEAISSSPNCTTS